MLAAALCSLPVVALAMLSPPAASPRADPPAARKVVSPAAGLERHPHWALRALACMRLEGAPGAEATAALQRLAGDPDPRVRAFAVASLALRGAMPPAETLLADPDARILRAALRAGGEIDADAIARAAEPLLRAESVDARLCGVELAVFTDEPRLRARAMDRLGGIILGLDRTQAGALAPRLEQITGASAGFRPRDWQRWWQSASARTRTLARSRIGAAQAIGGADAGTFAEFAAALREAVERPIDLAFCIDSTSSMSRDLPAAQSAADAVSRLILDLVPGSRAGVVSYRDRRSEYIVRHWSLTSELAVWRSALWELIADKGGSEPEAVEPALRTAYESLEWQADRRGVVVLIGDGPPHPGTRGVCAALAAAARERLGITTFTLGADLERDIKGFAEIAAAGGGRSLRLSQGSELPGAVLGSRFGDQWAPLLRAFLDRCDLLIR